MRIAIYRFTTLCSCTKNGVTFDGVWPKLESLLYTLLYQSNVLPDAHLFAVWSQR